MCNCGETMLDGMGWDGMDGRLGMVHGSSLLFQVQNYDAGMEGIIANGCLAGYGYGTDLGMGDYA